MKSHLFTVLDIPTQLVTDEQNAMNLELLPNEILLVIFEYFNGIELLFIFYGLNPCFNSFFTNDIEAIVFGLMVY